VTDAELFRMLRLLFPRLDGLLSEIAGVLDGILSEPGTDLSHEIRMKADAVLAKLSESSSESS
jgi:hypothetical protein